MGKVADYLGLAFGGSLALVDEEVKAWALVVFCSGFVVEDGECVSVV